MSRADSCQGLKASEKGRKLLHYDLFMCVYSSEENSRKDSFFHCSCITIGNRKWHVIRFLAYWEGDLQAIYVNREQCIRPASKHGRKCIFIM